VTAMKLAFAVLAPALLCGCGVRPETSMTDELPPVATFSIVAFDPATGELGVAVQSKFIAVGAVVPWAEADVGAIATQAWANTSFGPEGLRLLRAGGDPEKVLARLLAADKGRQQRQVGLVDAKGRPATFTGTGCLAWAGGKTGTNYAAQGNILAGPGVVDAMAKAFEAARGDLGERIIAALLAGQRAGGDKRGRQSAALLIVRKRAGYGGFNDRYRDLRVDDHPEPIKELLRIYRLHKSIFRPPKAKP
jgi:uncharacterized Ntn-hydrolase superfamily protein